MRKFKPVTPYEDAIVQRAKKFGLSRAGLAAACGISVRTLGQRLKCETEWTPADSRKLGEALRLTPIELCYLTTYRMPMDNPNAPRPYFEHPETFSDAHFLIVN